MPLHVGHKVSALLGIITYVMLSSTLLPALPWLLFEKKERYYLVSSNVLLMFSCRIFLEASTVALTYAWSRAFSRKWLVELQQRLVLRCSLGIGRNGTNMGQLARLRA